MNVHKKFVTLFLFSPDKIFVQPLLSIFLPAVTRLSSSFLTEMMYLTVASQCDRDKQEAVTKKPPTGPTTHAELQVAAPQMCPQKFKRQLNRCTKLQIREDIKQLNLLKGTMCHHLTVPCLLSPTKEDHVRAVLLAVGVPGRL